MEQEIKLPALWRTAEITLRSDGEDSASDTVELTFSSEEPYERWFGVEILGHTAGEVNLGWMASGRAPLLVDHDARVDNQVGTLVKVWLDGGRGKALARFGKNARSQEIRDRVLSGDLTNVSVGYRIDEMTLVQEKKDGPSVYRVTKWQPLEASIVTIPADQSVGVGRNSELDAKPVRILNNNMQKRTSVMDPVVETAAAPAPARETEVRPSDILAAERKRWQEIESLGARFNRSDLAREHIAKGTSLDAFRGVLIDVLGMDTVAEKNMNANSLGLSKKEVQEFRFTRLIAAAMNPVSNSSLHEAARFEIEVCQAEQQRSGKSARQMRGNQFSIPVDILRAPSPVPMQRDLLVNPATAGGNLVATNLMASDFITLLRNRMMVANMGARVMSGLEGNVAIPRQSGGSSFFWVAENGAPTESEQAFDQVSLTPKTGGAFTDFSRRLMLQSSIDVESLVRDDLINVIALGVDLAALHGTGASNQPLGLALTAGINSVAAGVNGAVPTWANLVQMETEVAVDNADIGTLGYLSNARVRGRLKSVEKAANTGLFVWETGLNGSGTVNGYRAEVSNQVRSNLTKGTSNGVCSAIFFGNWADLIIGQWSGIDLLVDPYTGSTAGTVRVVGMQDVDIAVRQPNSFCAMLDALTT